MRKILKYKTSFLTKLAFAASYGDGAPTYFAMLIELLSYIQILYIILTTSFSVSNEKNLLIFPQIRNLFSFLGLYDGASAFETGMSTELVWCAISASLCAYTIFLSVLAILCLKESNLKKGIVTLCTVLTTIHSKVLFCPIYYFYLNSILNHERCAINNQSLNMCGNVIKAFTLIFVMINGALAVLKEVICYQSYMNTNPFATKKNFHALIQLIHKITVLPIIVLSSHSLVAGSILNFFFALPCLILLLLKLPYYNIKILKTTVILSTITTTLSFILIWKTLVTSHYRIFELLIILIIPVFIKVAHERLNAIFEKILGLRVTSPEHVMHLYTLTEQYIFQSGDADFNENSNYETLFKHGLVQVRGLDAQAMKSASEVKNFKDETNLLILGELLRCYKKNPKSRTLALFITQFYIQKIKNASQAVVFMQKMENLPLSIPIQNVLVKIKDELESILFTAYSQKDPSLEFINYFKYREISNILKTNIASEVQLHIDFWQISSKEKVQAHKIIDISEKIDIIASKIQKIWEKNEKDFAKNFPVPLILYKVYISLLRGVPCTAEIYTNTSIEYDNKILKSMERWFSQEKASIVGSIQKGTLGIVLDASHSVQNLFNIKKEDLIGRKANILMPSMVQDKHDYLVDRYNKKPDYVLDTKNNVYCKTVDGQFFNAQLEIKVYPYIDKGIGLIAMMTKKHDCELMFFLGIDGNIADCSSELLNDFRANFTLSKHINIEEIAPELKKINEAFNVINIPKNLELSSGRTGIRNMSNSSSKIMKEDSQAPKQSRKSLREHQIFTFPEKEINLDSAARLISTRQNETQKTDAFLPQTTEREQLRIPLESADLEPEVNLPQYKHIAALYLTHITKHSHPISKEQVRKEFLNLNEAEKICEEVSNEKEKKVSFFTQDTLSNTFIKLTYFVKVDIFWFENQFYKVVKVRKPTKKDMTIEVKTPRWDVGSKRESQLGFKSQEQSLFDNKSSPDKPRKLSTYPVSLQDVIERKSFDEGRNTLLSIEAVKDNEEQNPDFFKKRNKKETKREEKTKIEKTLYDLFKNGHESTFTKAYFIIFYFAMLLVLILATVDFVSTRNSFEQIELGARLVDADTERAISLLKMWSMSNTIYTFLFQNKTIPSFLEYTSLLYDNANNIKSRSRDLNLLLPDINSQDVINAYYKKDIHLWDTSSNQPSNVAFDVFNAINIVVDKLLLFVNTKRNKLLNDPSLAVSTLNNTVNDLSISYLNEITAAMTARDLIYSSNITLLTALLIIEIAAMMIIFLSLIGLAYKIRKDHMRLFSALSTISLKTFEKRNKDLLRFRHCIQDSFENRKFITNLNSILEQDLEAKNNVQAKDFKLKDEEKFSFVSIRLRSLMRLVFAFVLFLFIITLACVSTSSSFQSIAKLKKIDAASLAVKQMGYQNNLLQGNVIFWLNFYGRENVTIRNDLPESQYDINLALLANANSFLLPIFNPEETFYSSDIDKILHSDVCVVVSASLLDMCKLATRGEILGQFGVNQQFYGLITTYIEQFRSNTTIKNADDTVYAYLMLARPYVATSDVAYQFIRQSLLETLFDTIDDESNTNKPFYISTCFVCVLVMFLVRLIVLENLKRFDTSKYKILMLIPQDILLKNKAVLLYLRTEFAKDLKSIL